MSRIDYDAIKKRNTFSKGKTIPYDEAVMFCNMAKMGQDDIGQTLNKINNGTGREGNPAIAPIVNNVSADAFRTMGILAAGGLADRWSKMDNKPQKMAEMALANLIEASALKSSGEPFLLRYGVQF